MTTTEAGSRYAGPMRVCYTDDQTEPPRSRNLELGGHLQLVDQTIPVCGPPPAGWLTLRQRISQLQAALATNVNSRRLTEAVLRGGDVLDIPTLLSLAVSERATNIRADIAGDVHVEALAALHEAYAPHARRRYTLAAARFDGAVRKFLALVEACGDPEAAPERVLASSPQAQAAWRSAPEAAAELDRLLPALSAAAELAGAPAANPPACAEIPLTCDPGDANRRQVWLGWHQLAETRPSAVLTMEAMVRPPQEHVGTRCGRWSLLLAAGAVLRACLAPGELEHFEPPRDRYIVNADPGGRKVAAHVVDPEDALRQGRLRRLVGALSGRHTPNQDDAVSMLDTVADAAPEGAHHED
jgi:hypothetical protein